MNQTVIIVIAVISVLVIAGVIVFFVIRNPEEDDVEDDVEVEVDVDVGGAGVTKIVRVVNNTFRPERLTIKKGDSVQWKFINGFNHSVVSNAVEGGSPAGGLFNSGVLATGGFYIHKFNTGGTFDYHCVAHRAEGMTGTIIVE